MQLWPASGDKLHTSALARLRHPVVAAVLAPLIDAGVVATCGVIEFELGRATRSSGAVP